MTIFRADKNFERFEDVTPSLLKKENVKLLLKDNSELCSEIEKKVRNYYDIDFSKDEKAAKEK